MKRRIRQTNKSNTGELKEGHGGRKEIENMDQS
jgi:hypothetical protein